MSSRAPRHTVALAALAAGALLAPGRVAAQHAGYGTRAGTPAAAPAAPLPPPDPAAVARARADSLRYPYTVADVGFMTHMIPHHAQALRMAALAEERAGSAAVRTLAERIINAQRDEITTMQRWLRDRVQPTPVVHGMGEHVAMPPDAAPMPGMAPAGAAARDAAHGGHGGDHATMPGMLTEAELAALAAARGAEFDRRFLVAMIAHHRGAVQMVEALFGSHGAGQDEAVFKFASDVHVDQITEIARMEQMLLQLVLGDG